MAHNLYLKTYWQKRIVLEKYYLHILVNTVKYMLQHAKYAQDKC